MKTLTEEVDSLLTDNLIDNKLLFHICVSNKKPN